MTPAEFQAARQSLGLPDRDLARMIEVSEARATQTFSDWSRGVTGIDRAKARLLRAYLGGYRPPDWPQDPGQQQAVDS